MKLTFKNVFLSVGMFVFALGVFGLVSTNKAEAFTRTATVTGNWADTVTWGGNSIPTSSDAVIINANVIVTINTAAVADTISIVDPVSGGNNGITIASPGSLDLTGGATGALTFVGSGGTSLSTVAVAGQSLSAKAIAINDGAGAGESTLSVTTGGTITTTGSGISFGGTGQAGDRLLNVGAGATLTLGGTTGTLGANANASDVTINATSTVAFTGSGAQTVPVYTYGHLTLGGTGAKDLTGVTTIGGNFAMSGTATASPAFTGNIAGSVTLSNTAVMTTAANMTVGTTLTVGTGATLHLDNYTFGVAGVSSITGTVDSTTGTGLKTFSSLVTVNSGGVFNLSGFNPTTAFGAGLTNNSATLMNIGSGASALVGNIGGTGAITWGGALTISSGTTTNSNTGIVTVTGTLALTGGWTQSTNSQLVLLATTATSGAGLLTTTLANTVTYGGGAQTLNAAVAPGYYNLTLSGTLAKSFPASTFVTQTLTVNSGTTITLLTSSTSTANKLYFGTDYQKKGTWSASTSGTGSNKSDTYFTSGVTYYITVTLGHSTTTAATPIIITPTTPVTCTLPLVLNTTTNACVTPTVTCTLPQVLNATANACVTPVVEVAGGCSAGNLFNTSTGAACVNNAVVAPGCSGGNLFNTSTGSACTNNTGITSEKKVYALGTVTLKNGSKGEAVKELQRFLNDKLSLGLVIDGKLGPKTIAVIKKWQKDNGLVSDGLIGAKTKAMMNK